MSKARAHRAAQQVARLALALVAGSVGCAGTFAPAGRSSPVDGSSGQIDLTSPGAPSYPPPSGARSGQPQPAPTDADVEQIATRVPRASVPTTSAQNPSRGPADAKVTLQVWSDFECPFCVRAAPALSAVEQRFHGQLRLVWRNYPLPSHAQARPAARAALEAYQQGGNPQFWRLHDWLFSDQADLSEAGLSQVARSFGLDAKRLNAAVQSTRHDAQIDADIAAGDAAGIDGTPAVFINDYYVMGARQPDEYAVVVQRALRD